MSVAATKPLLEVNLNLLRKHYKVFFYPDRPLSIGSGNAIKKYLDKLYPRHQVDIKSISNFLATWVTQPEYLEAIRVSRATSADGKAVRYTLFGNLVNTKKHATKAASKGPEPEPKTPPEKSRVIIDTSDITARGLARIKLRKST